MSQPDVVKDYSDIVKLAVDGDIDDLTRLVSHDKNVLSKRNSEGWTAVSGAAFSGHKEVLSMLISFGASVNIRDHVGRSPLHLSCLKGHTKISKYLLENGADANTADDVGCTPLHYAAKYGRVRISPVLIQNGANINACDQWGLNALQWAYINDHKDVAEVLTQAGATLPQAVSGNGDENAEWKQQLSAERTKRELAEKRVVDLELRCAEADSVAQELTQAMERHISHPLGSGGGSSGSVSGLGGESLANITDNARLKARLADWERRYDVLESELNQLRSQGDIGKDTRVKALQAELAETKRQCVEQETMRAETEKLLGSSDARVQMAEHRIAAVDRRLRETEAELSSSRALISDLKAQITENDNQVSQTNVEKQHLELVSSQLRRQLETADKKLQIYQENETDTEVQKRIHRLNRLLNDSEKARAALEERLFQLENLKIVPVNTQLKDLLDESEKHRDVLTEQISSLTTSLETKRKELEAVVKKVSALDAEVVQLQTDKKQAEDMVILLQDVVEQSRSWKAQAEEAEKRARSLEGQLRDVVSAKAVLEEKYRDVAGRVTLAEKASREAALKLVEAERSLTDAKRRAAGVEARLADQRAGGGTVLEESLKNESGVEFDDRRSLDDVQSQIDSLNRELFALQIERDALLVKGEQWESYCGQLQAIITASSTSSLPPPPSSVKVHTTTVPLNTFAARERVVLESKVLQLESRITDQAHELQVVGETYRRQITSLQNQLAELQRDRDRHSTRMSSATHFLSAILSGVADGHMDSIGVIVEKVGRLGSILHGEEDNGASKETPASAGAVVHSDAGEALGTRLSRLNDKLLSSEFQRSSLENKLSHSERRVFQLEQRLLDAQKIQEATEGSLRMAENSLHKYAQDYLNMKNELDMATFKLANTEQKARTSEELEKSLSKERTSSMELAELLLATNTIMEEQKLRIDNLKFEIQNLEAQLITERNRSQAQTERLRDLVNPEEFVMKVLESDLVSEEAFEQVHAALMKVLADGAVTTPKKISSSPSSSPSLQKSPSKGVDLDELFERCSALEIQALSDRRARATAVEEAGTHRQARLVAESLAEKERLARSAAESELSEERRRTEDFAKRAEALRLSLQEAENRAKEEARLRLDMELSLSDERRRRMEAQERATDERKQRLEMQQSSVEIREAQARTDRTLDEERRVRIELQDQLRECRTNILSLQNSLEEADNSRALAEEECSRIKAEIMGTERAVAVERMAKVELETRLMDALAQLNIELTGREWAESQLAEERANKLLLEQKVEEYRLQRIEIEGKLRAERLNRLAEEDMYTKKQVDDMLQQERVGRIAAEETLTQERQLRSSLEAKLKDEKSARMAAERELIDLESRISAQTGAEYRLDVERQLKQRLEEELKQEKLLKVQLELDLRDVRKKLEECEWEKKILSAKVEEEKQSKSGLLTRIADETRQRQAAEAREAAERTTRIEVEGKLEEEHKARLEALNRVYEQSRGLRAAHNIAKMEHQARMSAEERAAQEAVARKEIEERVRSGEIVDAKEIERLLKSVTPSSEHQRENFGSSDSFDGNDLK